MPFDIVTISPTVSDAAHAAGDVMFNLTAAVLPARKCKLINIFMEVASGGGEDDTKIGVLFFGNNTTASLGTLNATADISAANFTANEYQGQLLLGLTDGGNLDLDGIDNVALYHSTNAFSTAAGTRAGNGQMNMVVKGGAPSRSKSETTVYVAAIVHSGAPDLDGTDNVKLHLHVEY
tara:strand:- start:1142 stop:1675 length:534 start_codon:yes stop_codon:yes gene_type:complete